MNTKITFAILVTGLLLVGCAHHPVDDATLQQRVAGTWTTKKIALPGNVRFSGITLALGPDGSYLARYTVVRPGSSQPETLTGTWHIENGVFLESLTNSTGKTLESNGGSKILKVTGHHLVISNWNNPHRVFSRVK